MDSAAATTMAGTEPEAVSRQLFRLSIGIFFIGGFLTAIVSLLVPRFKLLNNLDYSQALLVQLASHASYLLFALPITLIILRIGYMRAIAIGTAIMAIACVALTTADAAGGFELVLAALLLLSLGITFLQIAANTVVTVIGESRRSAARLTLLQGFNSGGTVIGPLLAAPLLLGASAVTIAADPRIGLPFIGSAVVLVILSVLFFRGRNLLPGKALADGPRLALRRVPALLGDRRLVAGTAAMFAYVGAEVTIGTLLTNYLMRPEILGLPAVDAGRLVSVYWGGAMLGRFAGALLLRRAAADRLLVAAAVAAAVLTVIATIGAGTPGAVALLAVGLFNAIMYPTIYALALPADPVAAPLGAMLLCMAVVGGAVVPVLTGVTADHFGLAPALLLPAFCYVVIAAFARSCRVEAS